MSPIYVRPEREQAEHDRLIRFLQAKYSQELEALANPGDEQVAPVKVGGATHFPDIVLNEEKRLAGTVEVETVASVNNLEVMAKWVPFSRARVPFFLYVPVPGYETALRLAEAHHVKAAEIWTYRSAVEGFDLVRMFVDPAFESARPAKTASRRTAQGKAVAAPRAAASRPAAGATRAGKAAKKSTKGASRAASGSAKAGAARKPASKAKAEPARKSTASSRAATPRQKAAVGKPARKAAAKTKAAARKRR